MCDYTEQKKDTKIPILKPAVGFYHQLQCCECAIKYACGTAEGPNAGPVPGASFG